MQGKLLTLYIGTKRKISFEDSNNYDLEQTRETWCVGKDYNDRKYKKQN